MPQRMNSFGQAIGEPVPGWSTRPAPPRAALDGRLCRLEPLCADVHAIPLHAAYAEEPDGANWTYLPYGPFASHDDYVGFVRWGESRDDTRFYAIVDRVSGLPTGVASYLRIDPLMGSIEVGHLSYSPALQRTAASTEAMYLMMHQVFEKLGYRRYEWKCDSLNAPSRAAAERLGFRYEGTFRNAVVAKERNRDTAWFSITDAHRGSFSPSTRIVIGSGSFAACIACPPRERASPARASQSSHERMAEGGRRRQRGPPAHGGDVGPDENADRHADFARGILARCGRQTLSSLVQTVLIRRTVREVETDVAGRQRWFRRITEEQQEMVDHTHHHFDSVARAVGIAG